MPAWKWFFAFCVFALSAAFGAGGCGEEVMEPKVDLTEEEKKQVQELNQQRVDEWGKKRK